MLNRIAAARPTKSKSPDCQWHQVCQSHITAAPNVTQIESNKISVDQFILLRLVLKMKPNLNPNIIWQSILTKVAMGPAVGCTNMMLVILGLLGE